MMRKPHQKTIPTAVSPEFVLAALERLNREKADLLEEVRQLRAAVSIYRRIAEQVTSNQLSSERKSA